MSHCKKIKIILASAILTLPVFAVGQTAQAIGCEWKASVTLTTNSGGGFVGGASMGGSIDDLINKDEPTTSDGCTFDEMAQCKDVCNQATKPKNQASIGSNTVYYCCPIEVGELPAAKPYESLEFTPQVKIPDSEFDQDKVLVGIYDEATNQVNTDLLAKYIRAIYYYGLRIAAILAAIVLMAGGVLWIVSGGDASKVTQAKELIIGSVVGLIILLSSWIILNTINPSLINLKVLSTTLVDVVDPEPKSFEGNLSNSRKCDGCVALTVPYKDGGQANAALSAKLDAAWQTTLKTVNFRWRVNEAYPPTVYHASRCHYNGMCVDIGFDPAVNPPDCTNVTKLIEILKGAGLNILNEYPSCKGVTTPNTTGGHLHVY